MGRRPSVDEVRSFFHVADDAPLISQICPRTAARFRLARYRLARARIEKTRAAFFFDPSVENTPITKLSFHDPGLVLDIGADAAVLSVMLALRGWAFSSRFPLVLNLPPQKKRLPPALFGKRDCQHVVMQALPGRLDPGLKAVPFPAHRLNQDHPGSLYEKLRK